jgi:superfamily II DNA/RNA helicase
MRAAAACFGSLSLDIEALPHVVNFDLAHVAEDHVHRIGRISRAGALSILPSEFPRAPY